MKTHHRFDFSRLVGWILFAAVVIGIIGICLQFWRYGALVESGSIGPSGE